MAQQAELLSAIDILGATSVTATVFRHTAPGREPLAGARARLFGGRWNITNGPSTVYLARPVESCIAEFLRNLAPPFFARSWRDERLLLS